MSHRRRSSCPPALHRGAADQILVLDRGRIIERGRQRANRADGKYARLCEQS